MLRPHRLLVSTEALISDQSLQWEWFVEATGNSDAEINLGTNLEVISSGNFARPKFFFEKSGARRNSRLANRRRAVLTQKLLRQV